jgi:hypothetical protein
MLPAASPRATLLTSTDTPVVRGQQMPRHDHRDVTTGPNVGLPMKGGAPVRRPPGDELDLQPGGAGRGPYQPHGQIGPFDQYAAGMRRHAQRFGGGPQPEPAFAVSLPMRRAAALPESPGQVRPMTL